MADLSFPQSAMENPKTPLSTISTFVHQHFMRLGSEFSNRFEEGKRFVHRSALSQFASVNQELGFNTHHHPQAKHAFDIALSADYVAKTLAGTSVYTVSNMNNEFVQLKQPGLGGARVVPITLDQELHSGFSPDPAQIRNAWRLDILKAADLKSGFDGVPVFQSDLLVVKKKNKRYSPIYFQKEDIERELSKVSRASRGSCVSQHIMVGSLEDVLKKMEVNEKNSGWEDLIFIPPGKSYSQHLQEVASA
ncbi:hypothetical protein MKW92_026811 [Papaver armeniacum]|nr:hypothetical protein MKW92_026811 [Papaver armeniacum]